VHTRRAVKIIHKFCQSTKIREKVKEVRSFNETFKMGLEKIQKFHEIYENFKVEIFNVHH